MIDRAIRTFKTRLKKAEYDERDLHLFLLDYRNTPIDANLPLPATLLFNREVKSLLPGILIFNEGERNSKVRAWKIDKIIREGTYNMHTKELSEFGQNNRIRVQKPD